MEGKLKTHRFYRTIIEEVEEKEAKEQKPNGEVGCLVAAFLRERKRKGDLGFYGDQQFLHVLADFFGAGLDTTLTTIR